MSSRSHQSWWRRSENAARASARSASVFPSASSIRTEPSGSRIPLRPSRGKLSKRPAAHGRTRAPRSTAGRRPAASSRTPALPRTPRLAPHPRPPTATSRRRRRSRAAPPRSRVAVPVRADLGAIPAHRHLAPHARAVARAVVERPRAVLGAAGLDALPGAVLERVRHGHEQPRERAGVARPAASSASDPSSAKWTPRPPSRATRSSVRPARDPSSPPLCASISDLSASRSSSACRCSAASGATRWRSSPRRAATLRARAARRARRCPSRRRACSRNRSRGRSSCRRGHFVLRGNHRSALIGYVTG